MARGTTLIKLLTEYRAKARLSLNPAHNVQVRETQVALLQATQEWLWNDFDWPHMEVERQQVTQNGQRYYDPPSDVKIDRIIRLEVFANGCWERLTPGIGAFEYSTHNSDLSDDDVSTRAWPPLRWRLHEDEDLEIWPVPDQDAVTDTREGYLKIVGTRDLSPFVEDTDRADLDDRLIVGFAVAETLAATGAKDAQIKLDQANELYRRLRAGMTKRTTVKMFGIGQRTETRRFVIGSYRSQWGN